MTKKELINTYLRSIGRTRVQGDSTEPLLPFLLGDAIYTIYNRDIAPLELHREEKKLRNDWEQHYTLFNRPFFASIGTDNHDQVTDLMDDFEDAINRDAYALANMWHNTINLALVDPNKTKGIPPAINALCRKIYRWLEDN